MSIDAVQGLSGLFFLKLPKLMETYNKRIFLSLCKLQMTQKQNYVAALDMFL